MQFIPRIHFRPSKIVRVHWERRVMHWKSNVVVVLVWCPGHAWWNLIPLINWWTKSLSNLTFDQFYIANNTETWTACLLSIDLFMERWKVFWGSFLRRGFSHFWYHLRACDLFYRGKNVPKALNWVNNNKELQVVSEF
jgi:hypothetical protein